MAFFDKNSPYQFYIPTSLKRRAIKKSLDNNVAIAPFMKMALEQFVDSPIEDLLVKLKRHKSRKARKRKNKTKPKGVRLNI